MKYPPAQMVQERTDAADEPPVIELRGIHKSFGSKELFRGLDFRVRKGETVTLMGTSGCGKSVCLKMMVGLEEPDEGVVLFEGIDITKMDAAQLARLRQRMSLVFQRDALFDSLTVLENVGYALYEHTERSDEDIRARALECLHWVNLEPEVLDKMPIELSGGMRKRVALARAVAFAPEVVLYDEPTEGLDPQSITRVRRMIERLDKELGNTSVIATHNMPTAFRISDRLALIHDGRIDNVGTPEEFRLSKVPEVHDFVWGPGPEGTEIFRGESA
jgi:phospholipid/cholesterol/gamma-HCH transport system ATP-binding protein